MLARSHREGRFEMKFQLSVLDDCTQSVPLASVPERGQPSQCHRRDILSEGRGVSSQGKSVERILTVSWWSSPVRAVKSHDRLRLGPKKVARGCQWQLSVSLVARSSIFLRQTQCCIRAMMFSPNFTGALTSPSQTPSTASWYREQLRCHLHFAHVLVGSRLPVL
jgi:hypothetical protein